MDWDKLRVFHAVASVGSLTHAGDELNLSQSAISRQIRGLEEQLQVTLFHRHARGLLLTEEGELLHQATCAMNKRLTAAAARIRDAREGVQGELRVTATAGFGTMWLAPRLPRFFESNPGISINLILTESILDLPMREADVAIRMASPSQADVIRRPLMDVVIQLYASRDYLEARGTPRSMTELADHRFIGFRPLTPRGDAVTDWQERIARHATGSRLTTNSYFGVLKAALNGLGVAALPDYITRDYPELLQILPETTAAPFTVYFVYPEELRRSQRVAAFREFMLQEVKTVGRDDRKAKVANRT